MYIYLFFYIEHLNTRTFKDQNNKNDIRELVFLLLNTTQKKVWLDQSISNEIYWGKILKNLLMGYKVYSQK